MCSWVNDLGQSKSGVTRGFAADRTAYHVGPAWQSTAPLWGTLLGYRSYGTKATAHFDEGKASY